MKKIIVDKNNVMVINYLQNKFNNLNSYLRVFFCFCKKCMLRFGVIIHVTEILIGRTKHAFFGVSFG